MHIPDGYLSPSTCATFYAASAPFWYVAMRRVKAELSGPAIPLLAVFAAFSFTIMMFNLPLPGGTTGHAVGMAMGAIVLGPAMSIIAVSMALLIQALFFGDGGITAYGANCFNMAIVGSLVAYAVYRLLAGRAPLRSQRRILAAGFAGYAAINSAAFCAAVEFGVQPRWFHDAAGAPLYAPYPLHIAIPAMLLGHLTIAGLAEFVVTAGLVGYLQRTNVDTLRRTAPSTTPLAEISPGRPLPGLWMVLGVLVILTPLGILAAGKAWGEWKPQDFRHPPLGLERLSHLWQPPLAGYAPSFVHSAATGYLLSALVGVALIFFLAWGARRAFTSGAKKRGGFLEITISGLLSVGQEALFAENIARGGGFLQRLDPRVKIAGLGALIVAAVSVRRLWVLLALFGMSLLCAQLSRLSWRRLAKGVWLPVLAFSGLVALPALLLGSTGWRSAAFLVLRAETAATFSSLLMLTTLWNHLLRALRFWGVPAATVAVLSMTYRYLFVFLESAQNTLEGRRSRLVGRVAPALERQMAAASVGALLDKTMQLSADVYGAMRARGFRGEICLLSDLRMQARDWWQLSGLLAIAALAFGLGK